MQVNWGKLWLTIFFSLIIANLIYIDYQILFPATEVEQISTGQRIVSGKPYTSFPTENWLIEKDNGQSIEVADYNLILEQIRQATSSLSLQVNDLNQAMNQISLASPEAVPVPVSASVTGVSGVSEYYIPLGSGSTNSTSWIELSGVESFVAPTNYGQINSMYFEAALRIPTGNGRVYARLKNVTDNVSLFESEVSHEGVGGKLISSGKIPVPTSNKLYRVELKSTLGATVNLDNARIKIFVEK